MRTRMAVLVVLRRLITRMGAGYGPVHRCGAGTTHPPPSPSATSGVYSGRSPGLRVVWPTGQSGANHLPMLNAQWLHRLPLARLPLRGQRRTLTDFPFSAFRRGYREKHYLNTVYIKSDAKLSALSGQINTDHSNSSPDRDVPNPARIRAARSAVPRVDRIPGQEFRGWQIPMP